ncbi:MAG: agmatinase [Bacteroidetes bacterium]|nr:agmatinase [Bacteroidota bacterium]MDA0903163.1 agmatinase [Bacteroidota bacterium]MDA1242410.1 agmatinase [Bacteroidota bacterium]
MSNLDLNSFGARVYSDLPEAKVTLADAKVVMLPVPYDGTSTWGKGADSGPSALLDATDNMEVYDIETGTEVHREGIWVADDILEDASPESMTAAVKDHVTEVLALGKIPFVLGGEHSVSIGAIQACKAQHPDLAVLHIDAHADLRPTYHGSACNHACAVHWASKHTTLVQVGIRSMDASEREHVQEGKLFTGDDCHAMPDDEWMAEALAELGARGVPLYITIDLDAFDPAFVPHTGTPEPGGLTWHQVTRLVRLACRHGRVVGMDVVELAANEHSAPSDFLAAKLTYKMLTYALQPDPIA